MGVGYVQILVEIDLSQQVLFNRSFIVEDGIDPDQEFKFENMMGQSKTCDLLTQVGMPCSGPSLPVDLQLGSTAHVVYSLSLSLSLLLGFRPLQQWMRAMHLCLTRWSCLRLICRALQQHDIFVHIELMLVSFVS